MKTVDDTVPAYLGAVINGLGLGGFNLPADLYQADAAEVIEVFPTEGDGKLNPAGKAFIRRAIALANRKKEVAGALPVDSPSQHPRLEKLEDVFGVEVSAEAVASALGAKPAPVDVQDLLSKAQCSALPSSMLTDVSIWQGLAADSEAAKKQGKQAFTYVDFTAKAMLPPWLPADAVGGKRKRPDGGAELDPDSNTSSLQVLSTALQSAVAEPRTLRGMAQWAAVYLRYAPMAVAVGQLTWASALAHMASIMKLGEQERLAKTQGFVAIRYDAALRKSWARRILQGDPDLDIPKECSRINDEVLDAVRVQLGASTASGLTSSSSAPRPAVSSRSQWAEAAAEGALAKVGAAAQAMTRRVEQATREMARAEQSLAAREEAMQGPSIGGGKSGKSGKTAAGKAGKDGKGQGGGGSKKRKWHGHWW